MVNGSFGRASGELGWEVHVQRFYSGLICAGF